MNICPVCPGRRPCQSSQCPHWTRNENGTLVKTDVGREELEVLA